MRSREIPLNELRKIMQKGQECGYFKWKPADEIDALDFLRLEIEWYLQQRQGEELDRKINAGQLQDLHCG